MKTTVRSTNKQRVKTSQKSIALSVRASAAKIILQVLDQGQSLSSLLPEYQAQVKAQDFPLLQEICFGVCRVLPRLEKLISLLVDRSLKGKTRIVHCLLLVGLYQLLYTRIPPHAAVDEVVNATSALKADSFRGLVNAVLRRFLREQAKLLAKADQHWQTLHPEWLVNRLKKAYPHWQDIVQANNQKPPMWLRVNKQHCSAEDYRQLLVQQDINASSTTHPQALRLAQPSAVQNLPNFAQGWVTVQDLSAQWSALLLQAQNDELILDACAAPGGKTTHILELAPQAKVVALDVEAERLVRVQENLARMQQQALVICGDAAQPQQWLTQIEAHFHLPSNATQSAVQFDRILLDAPCSATGVIRRHPDIKWLRQESDIAALVALQEQILDALWARLKPNGVLLYATCSLLPEENCRQIAHFLQRHNDAKREPLPFLDPQQQGEIQLFPTENGGDGFYYAKLRKMG